MGGFKFLVSGFGLERDKSNSQLNLLYLGRRHPLKGVEYLERAVKELNHGIHGTHGNVELKIVSTAFGEELERVWEWCDVLVLPTLSENFGLVVAEALERGKRVITTDGAPVWGAPYINRNENRYYNICTGLRGLVCIKGKMESGFV